MKKIDDCARHRFLTGCHSHADPTLRKRNYQTNLHQKVWFGCFAYQNSFWHCRMRALLSILSRLSEFLTQVIQTLDCKQHGPMFPFITDFNFISDVRTIQFQHLNS